MRRRIIFIAVGIVGLLAGVVPASATSGPMAFEPIEGSAYGQQTAAWTEPFVVADGCMQDLVVDETSFDIYPGADDLTDMNVTNETGKHAGRYLYRTQEVGSNGSVSVVDLATGQAEVLVQDSGYRRLDGLTWTPWGTLLFAEETAGGRLFEAFLDPDDPSRVDRVETRHELGIMRHEGIGAARDGSVFVIDELNGGSIYRFVPAVRGDLSDGQLYALRLNALSDADQVWNQQTYTNKTGAFQWVPLNMAQVVVDADAASNAVHATEFGRPEDVQIIGKTVYIANTSEDRVVAINLKTNTLTGFVQSGSNVPVEDEDTATTGFNGPDNLAAGRNGQLWIVEDNTPSDIWVASKASPDGVADDVSLFASLVDPDAEASGIYFAKNDPHTLYVNVQHPEKPLADGTWTITCRGASGA